MILDKQERNDGDVNKNIAYIHEKFFLNVKKSGNNRNVENNDLKLTVNIIEYVTDYVYEKEEKLENYLGKIEDIEEIVEKNNIQEIIFVSRKQVKVYVKKEIFP